MDLPDVPAYERTGVRMPWSSFPRPLREDLARHVGARITGATARTGGYSPALACDVHFDDGSQLFIKAIRSDVNPDTPAILLREAHVLALLPSGVNVPRLRWFHDDGAWVAMGLDCIRGATPTIPWDPAQLQRVIGAWDRTSALLTPAPAAFTETVQDHYCEQFTGWRTIDADPTLNGAGLDAATVARLAAVEATWEDAARGTSLNHCDLRSDNIVIDAGGEPWFVDWPAASTGAAWFDIVCSAPAFALEGAGSPGDFVAMSATTSGVDPDAITAVAVALAGYFTHRAQLAPPPGLPTVRAFQAAQGAVARQWILDRLA